MALKSNAKFEEKIWCARFVQSMHFLTLKFREELDVMALKSGAKSDEKLTWYQNGIWIWWISLVQLVLYNCEIEYLCSVESTHCFS